jgi:hypothetical protein
MKPFSAGCTPPMCLPHGSAQSYSLPALDTVAVGLIKAGSSQIATAQITCFARFLVQAMDIAGFEAW